MSNNKPKGVGQALKGFGRALGIVNKPFRYEDRVTITELDPGFFSTIVTKTKKKKKVK